MVELGKISNIYSGVALKSMGDGPVRIMRLADLSDIKAGRHPRLMRGLPPNVARAHAIQEGDLIIAARGNCTDICTARESIIGAYISLDLYLLRPKPTHINSEYLRTVLELPSSQLALSGEKQGTGLARLPKEALEKTKVIVPPLDRQRLIAELALAFDDEQRLMRAIGELKSDLSLTVLSNAIKNTEKNFSRRPT